MQVADKKGDVITQGGRQPFPRRERENRITCIFFGFCILNDWIFYFFLSGSRIQLRGSIISMLSFSIMSGPVMKFMQGLIVQMRFVMYRLNFIITPRFLIYLSVSLGNQHRCIRRIEICALFLRANEKRDTIVKRKYPFYGKPRIQHFWIIGIPTY